jgi:hypothetical protein
MVSKICLCHIATFYQIPVFDNSVRQKSTKNIRIFETIIKGQDFEFDHFVEGACGVFTYGVKT